MFPWNRAVVVATILFAITAGLAVRAATDEPGLTLTADTPWIVARNQPEPVLRAIEDVRGDWYKVFGMNPVMLEEPPADSWNGGVIHLGLVGGGVAAAQRQCAGPEGFVVKLTRDGPRPALVVTGADARGAIYAVYALAEEILRVDPLYFFTDQRPPARKSITLPPGYAYEQGPPTFRYRGWFTNDEDLLHGLSPDPMREGVYSLDLVNRVCEALLRLRGNVIIPGSRIFPDERCHELASRRGLILNKHGLGVDTRRYPAGVPLWHAGQPEVTEGYWRTGIDALKGYEILWNVGYKPSAPDSFWHDDPALDTPQKRGEVISRAIAKQVELVRRVQPDARFTSNIWSEAPDLLAAGHLTLPPGVIAVWPDDGSGVMRDQGRAKAGDGMYYHTAMLSDRGNQLSEAVNPARIYREVGRFARAGATAYFLLNVSDIRPVPLSTTCVMKFVWDTRPYQGRSDQENMDRFLREWCEAQYGAEVAPRAAGLYREYFDIPCLREDVRQGENAIFRGMYKLSDAVMDPRRRTTPEQFAEQSARMRNYAWVNRPPIEALADKAESAAASVPEERRRFFVAHLVVPLRIQWGALALSDAYARAADAWRAGDTVRARDCAAEALAAADLMLEDAHRGEYDGWTRWYQGDKFVGMATIRDRVRHFHAVVSGLPPPPIRPRQKYEDMTRYQHSFKENFPLMHPPGRGASPSKQSSNPSTDDAATYRRFEVTDSEDRVIAMKALPDSRPPIWARNVSQRVKKWTPAARASFADPIPFVVAPRDAGEPFHPHNHQPSITWLPNGDLLAIWYSTVREIGTELTVLASRLRDGESAWDPSSEFFKATDRNMHGAAVFHNGKGTLYHFNGMGKKGVSTRERTLALLLRTSADHGVTWSQPRAIAPRYTRRHQAISGTILTSKGTLVQPCDDAENGGSALQLSMDQGTTWFDPGEGKPPPRFEVGGRGEGTIAGIHAGIVELKDGLLMGLARGATLDGRMPTSFSRDGGLTWKYEPSPFPPIGRIQRLVFARMIEGPLMLVSFTSENYKEPEANGMTFVDADGEEFIGHGMYAALSFDEGKTWPVRKLLTPGKGDYNGGARTDRFTATPTRAEHGGYLAATQSPDGIVHLISSGLYYRFNLAWLKAGTAPKR